MNCWLGDTFVPLPDVNTENPSVSQAYQQWIGGFIQEYAIDGLRIDGECRLLLCFQVLTLGFLAAK
jgi:hypothetical protein